MRRITNARRKALQTSTKLLSGRQILYMIYEHFRSNKNVGLVYTICDLAYVKWLGDERMETFRNNWETTLAGMSAQVDDSHLTELLLQQMMQSKELKDQVTQFRKRDLDDPLRCYHT